MSDSFNYNDILVWWPQLHEPLSIFQSVFQAMVLGFTPLFGHNNLPEIDLRLASHVLAWIYERHAEEVAFCLETLNVVEVPYCFSNSFRFSFHNSFRFSFHSSSYGVTYLLQNS